MQSNTAEFDRHEDETPTAKQLPSGKWLVQIDRAQRLIADAIVALESGADVDSVVADLKDAQRLVDGGGSEGAR